MLPSTLACAVDDVVLVGVSKGELAPPHELDRDQGDPRDWRLTVFSKPFLACRTHAPKPSLPKLPHSQGLPLSRLA